MELERQTINGQIVDVLTGSIFPGEIVIEGAHIVEINKVPKASHHYILPGLVDAHVHIESSMLVPSEFARLAVVHGTVATVSDPHEIANVCGIPGIDFMIENAAQVPFYFYFGAPSCVPATKFETAGAGISAEDISILLARENIHYLTEMMNYPGVIDRDPEVMEKLKIAKALGKPIDGHAPGLRGEEAMTYFAAGISTDHECFSYEEALEKIQLGVNILIREGSAAKNFDALIGLLKIYPEKIMFCSDDKHPDALVLGHINHLLHRAVKVGCRPMDAIRAATLNPVKHYQLKNGLLQIGDAADFIIVKDLEDFQVLETWIKGQKIAAKGKTLIPSHPAKRINNFNCNYLGVDDIRLEPESNFISVIEVHDGQLITGSSQAEILTENNNVISNVNNDVLKLVVLNRYQSNTKPAIGFVKNFNLREGAMASSVAHDSHNIIALGTDDESIVRAINLVIEEQGGISYVGPNDHSVIPLPIAGLMSDHDGYEIAEAYQSIDLEIKKSGCTLNAPYMTLSFLALLVIPELKLSDLGLFDGKAFRFKNLFITS